MTTTKPTRVGVTGHRTVPDPEAARTLIQKTLDDHGVRPVFIVISPLAEGADRLVAQAVLHYVGSSLEAVLPLTLDDYLEDFSSEESRQEFQELLSRCPLPVYLRSRRIADETQKPREQAALRNAAYEAAGHYVADHCDILIALWDGEPSRGRGGTADIVAYARQQGRKVIRIWKEGCTILS